MARFEPVGHVRNDRTEMLAGHWANIESRIELVPLYAKGLAGLGEFSHVMVVFHLDRIPAFERKDDVRLPGWVDRMMDGYF